ncbi:GH92 family glycosyl hydrolase [Sphingobacterium chuzhouense]|uniref:Glycoside hydrolase family 92 protein n=1 Tax=Sphingobacterium chuzhouense TaxID=1742264 RepID=A0ABR7XXC6_9SPHI|nr:GH92 family glycosyl hydrolase [Sphingobacterium chuzhouense]MBD1423709.1 glycoside hydrolase family 92 protein [Sphingobacterium chuzhouense]
MKKILLYILFLSICLPSAAFQHQTADSLTTYVKTDIGTAHSRWFHYAPASVPFGMAKAGPSTNGHYGNTGGWQAVGYDPHHTSIEGFPNFHEFQIGGVVFAPATGRLLTYPGKLETPEDGYRSTFDKKDEFSAPGYYAVYLKKHQVTAELTATKRVAFHRYTFPRSNQSHVLFDIGNRQGESGPVLDAYVEYDGGYRIEGYVITNPVYVDIYQKGADVKMYFSAVVDKKPTSWGTFKGKTKTEGKRKEKGVGAGIYLSFDTEDQEKILIKVGLSYTSIENARQNLKQEADELSFEQAKIRASQEWNNMLGRIQVEGGKQDDKIKFYTGLYHALLGRGLASDCNGAYPKNDGSIGYIPTDIHNVPVHQHYNTDAIWGAFWNLTQLWSLVYPEYYDDWIKSQLLVYKDAGWLGDGIAASRYVSGVGTNFTSLAIAAAYNVGIRNFDVQLAYDAARKNELDGHNRIAGAGKLDVSQFVNRGYSPYADELHMQTTAAGSGFAASHTLEYAFSAYAVANFAKALGKREDYKKLQKLSHGWRLLYDDKLDLIRPKDSLGNFIEHFNPQEPWRGFQEGNAIQYTFYVPHHIEDLVRKMGRKDFVNRLDSIMLLSEADYFGGGKTLDAFSGLQAVYNHGNQPNLHVSWLFNFAGRPDLTQKWVRAICDKFYGVSDIHGYGFGQDEDQGQLGAWYVMAAMGLFDVKGLTAETPTFQFSTPLFEKIRIQLNPAYYPGERLYILTKRESEDARYIHDTHFNGKKVNGFEIKFHDLVKGGELKFNSKNNPKR